MGRISLTIIFIMLFTLINIKTNLAYVPEIINYQARLIDSDGKPLTTSIDITFDIFESEVGGTPVWTETHNLTPEEGYVNSYLGTINPLSLPFDKQYWLMVTINGETHYDRTPLTSSPHALFSRDAFHADSADLAMDVQDGIITIEKIADKAINATKMNAEGIQEGYILKSDGFGGVVWTDDIFGLPFIETYSEDANVFSITNYGEGDNLIMNTHGTGSAGRFRGLNPNSNSPTLYTSSASTSIGAYAFYAERNAPAGGYTAYIRANRSTGSGLLVENNTSYPTSWKQGDLDPDNELDAALVVRNLSNDPDKLAIKTYGDIMINSSLYANQIFIESQIILGDPNGNFITLQPPAQPGGATVFDGNININGNLNVAGTSNFEQDVMYGGKLKFSTGIGATLGIAPNNQLEVDIPLLVNGNVSSPQSPTQDNHLTNRRFVFEFCDSLRDDFSDSIGIFKIELDKRVDSLDDNFKEFTSDYVDFSSWTIERLYTDSAASAAADSILNAALNNEKQERTDSINSLKAGVDAYQREQDSIIKALGDSLKKTDFELDKEIDSLKTNYNTITIKIDSINTDIVDLYDLNNTVIFSLDSLRSKDSSLIFFIDAEEDARKAADSLLQAALQNEINSRDSSDKALQDSIKAEEDRRYEEDRKYDSTMRALNDAMREDIRKDLQRAEQEWVNNYINDLDRRITANLKRNDSLKQALGEEEFYRRLGDGTLLDSLNSEKQQRTSGDSLIFVAVNDASNVRLIADSVLQIKIDAEETARKSADSALQQSLQDFLDNPDFGSEDILSDGNLDIGGNGTFGGILEVPVLRLDSLNDDGRELDVGGDVIINSRAFIGEVRVDVVSPYLDPSNRIEVNGDIKQNGNISTEGLEASDSSSFQSSLWVGGSLHVDGGIHNNGPFSTPSIITDSLNGDGTPLILPAPLILKNNLNFGNIADIRGPGGPYNINLYNGTLFIGGFLDVNGNAQVSNFLEVLGQLATPQLSVDQIFPNAGGQVYIQSSSTVNGDLQVNGDLSANGLNFGDEGLLIGGAVGNGTTQNPGGGTRMHWYPKKAAFRAGRVFGTEWNDGNIGDYSFATGNATKAGGEHSVAMGRASNASGHNSTSLGYLTTASGSFSTAMGYETTASGIYSTSIGHQSVANGIYSTAIGASCTVSGTSSFAAGVQNLASANTTIAIGYGNTASGNYSTALGTFVSTDGYNGAFSIGDASSTIGTFNNAANRMMMRFDNGYVLYTESDTSTGVWMGNGDNAWNSLSDERKKENILLADGEYFLDGLSKLRLGSWNYISQPDSRRHYGPMAQEIFKYFGKDEFGAIGCDTLLNTADMDGIMMICLQALEKRTKIIDKLHNEMDELKTQFFELKSQNEELHTLKKDMAEMKKALLKIMQKEEISSLE